MIKFDDIRRGRDIGLGERIITNVAQSIERYYLPVCSCCTYNWDHWGHHRSIACGDSLLHTVCTWPIPPLLGQTGEHSSVTSKELRDNTLRDGLVSEEADPTAFSACVTVPVSVLWFYFYFDPNLIKQVHIMSFVPALRDIDSITNTSQFTHSCL